MPKWRALLLILFTGYGVLIVPNDAVGILKDWEYTMLSFKFNSTDENAFATPLRVIRIKSGVYGLNGTIHLGVDLDNEYEVEVNLLRSASGDSHYSVYPLKVQKCSFYEYMNGPYKTYFMDGFHNCIGWPKFESEWKEPLKSNDFYANKCVITTDVLPSHLQDGYYKVVLKISGPLFRYVCEFLVKVTPIIIG